MLLFQTEDTSTENALRRDFQTKEISYHHRKLSRDNSRQRSIHVMTGSGREELQ